MTALLEFKDVTVIYGGVTALSGVSMTAEAGIIHGLIGPNGAGKSTLFNVASGLVRPRHGAVLLDGGDITKLGPHLPAAGAVRRADRARQHSHRRRHPARLGP
jgi:branched-chain amino acid transport system ATP-binding protein